MTALALLIALAAAPTASPPTVVSGLEVTAPKLVEELIVQPHAKCLDAVPDPGPLPRVVSTFPAAGSTVRPGVLVVRVTFDRPMTCSGFLRDLPRLKSPCPSSQQTMVLTFDRKTVRTVCIAEPSTAYHLAVGGGLKDFVSLQGRPAQEVDLSFSTSDGPAVVSVPEALAEDSGMPAPGRSVAPGVETARTSAPPIEVAAAPAPRAITAPAAEPPHEVSGLTVTPSKCPSYAQVRALWREKPVEIAASDQPLNASGPEIHKGGELAGSGESMSRHFVPTHPAQGLDRDYSKAFQPDGFEADAALAPYGAGKAPRMTPYPGTEAALRRVFESLDAGAPDYEEMSPELAEVVRTEWAGGKSMGLGKLVSVQFLYVSRHDLDVYEVDWECAKGQWGVGPLDQRGRISVPAGHLISYGSVKLPD